MQKEAKRLIQLPDLFLGIKSPMEHDTHITTRTSFQMRPPGFDSVLEDNNITNRAPPVRGLQ